MRARGNDNAGTVVSTPTVEQVVLPSTGGVLMVTSADSPSRFFGDAVVRELMTESQLQTSTENSRIYKALFAPTSQEERLKAMLEGLYQGNAPKPPVISKQELETFHGRRLAAQLAIDGLTQMALTSNS